MSLVLADGHRSTGDGDVFGRDLAPVDAAAGTASHLREYGFGGQATVNVGDTVLVSAPPDSKEHPVGGIGFLIDVSVGMLVRHRH